MEPLIRLAGLVLALLIILYALYRKGDAPVLAFVMLAPLSYFAINVGVVLTPAKLMGIVFLLTVLFGGGYLRRMNNRYLSYFLAYYIYTIFLTLVMTLFWPEQNFAKQGFLYGNTMRGLVSIAQVFMGLAIVIMILDRVTSAHSLLRVQVTMLLSMALISIYGLYVWLAQRINLPFNPIVRQGGLSAEIGRRITTVIDGEYVVRAYSLTGEPKSLSINADLGIVLSVFTMAVRDRIFRWFGGQTGLLVLFFATLYLTLSTAGYIVLPIVSLVAAGILVHARRLPGRTLARILALAGVLLIGAVIGGYDILGAIGKMIDTRVTERVGSDGLFTYADVAMVKFWNDWPHYTITGVGLGGSSFYIREYDTESYTGYVAAPRGIIGFIGDKGLIGLFLFASAMLKCLRPLTRATMGRWSPNWPVYSGILVICAISSVLMFTYALWYLEWLAVGLACTGATIAEREHTLLRMRREHPGAGVPALNHFGARC